MSRATTLVHRVPDCDEAACADPDCGHCRCWHPEYVEACQHPECEEVVARWGIVVIDSRCMHYLADGACPRCRESDCSGPKECRDDR